MGDIDDSDMAAVAERLRLVREARRRFLRMWAIDRTMVDPLVDRVAADLEAPQQPPQAQRPNPDAPLADES